MEEQLELFLPETEERAVTLRLCSLGSGSSGNALLFETEKEALLLDLGFSRKELLARMEKIHFSPQKLVGALLTHEHGDHSAGCRVFCDGCHIPLCTAPRTAGYLRARGKLPELVREFEPGSRFTLGGFEIESFALPHDAVEPVGFVVRTGCFRIGVATDLGSVSEATRQHLSGCDVLILESNYDRTMLMNSPRELSLKRRIFGPRGHMDNRDCCAALPGLLSDRTKLLLLAHVSRECNDPDLVRKNCAETLHLIGRTSLRFEVLSQDAPSGIYEFSAEREAVS